MLRRHLITGAGRRKDEEYKNKSRSVLNGKKSISIMPVMQKRRGKAIPERYQVFFG
jgi:hypothetical protein